MYMKKKITVILTSLFTMGALGVVAQTIPLSPTEITENCEGALVNGGSYLFGSNDIKITNKETSYISSSTEFNLNGYSGIVLEAAQTSTLDFNGSFKSTNSANTITIQKANSAGNTYLGFDGLIIDKATVNTGLDIGDGTASNSNRAVVYINLKNGGSFNYTNKTAAWNTKGFNLDIENGAFNISNSGRLVLYGSIANLSADSSIATDILINADETFSIGASITNKLNTGTVTLENNSTLVLNSTNVINSKNTGKTNISTYYASSARIELGADNDFGSFTKLNGASATLTIDLNEHVMTFESIDIANFTKIVLEDFVSGSFKSVNNITDEMLNKIVAYKDGDTMMGTELKDLEVKNTGGYYYLYSASAIPAVPEPAHWAVIFGMLALVFVSYRRRK